MIKMVRLVGNKNDIVHFVKMHSFARTITEYESLTVHTGFLLDAEAIAHDIVCHLCSQKYGKASGKLGERENAL